MKAKKTTKSDILYFIRYEIKVAVRDAKRYHRHYLNSVRQRDKIAEQYYYDQREASLQLARRMKNLTLPLNDHLHIYTDRLYRSRQRRWERESEGKNEEQRQGCRRESP